MSSRGIKLPSPDDTLRIALSLARAGWPVFPVTIYKATDGKRHKVPAVPRGTSWVDWATTDPEKIATAWGGEQAGCWIGVHAGAAGLVILDVDRDPADGKKSLKAAGLTPPPTFSYKTLGGGRHYLYAAPKGRALTNAQGLEHAGKRLAGVDVRGGNGLMVYYGPELGKVDDLSLARAPEWLLVDATPKTADRAPSADEAAFRARLVEGKPSKPVRKVLARVKPKGMSHDDMLEAVTDLVKLGQAGARGVGDALDVAREVYSRDWADAGRHWDNALAGSIKRIGLPVVTLDIPKAERKAIERRNAPEAVEEARAARKAVARVTHHETALATPDDGNRLLEDGPLAAELADELRRTWAYSDGLGIMRYDGRVWKPAQEHSLIEAVRQRLTEIEVAEHRLAALRGDNKAVDKARTLLSRSRCASVARLVIGILAEASPEFDAHPDLLNVQNGVVDLRTSTLLPHDPELYLTKIAGAAYDPDADSTLWNLARTALPAKTAEWLQVRLGQSATGYTPEDDVLVILEGAGENGKTSWLIGARRALGDYATTLPDRLLMASPNDHPTTLMNLLGARLGIVEELPEGRNLNVKRLKDTVGTPEITARRMRQDDMTFPATHALFIATNYLPIVVETDHGTWRRLALVRFPYKYVKTEAELVESNARLGDRRIKRHFEHEADAGLLAWIVAGARRWYDAGMVLPEPPKRVRDDTEAWRLDADPILAYTRERLVRDEGYAITTADLSADFNSWLQQRGHREWSQQTINSRFEGHVSLDGVTRKMCRFGKSLSPSRPPFSIKPIPAMTTSWRGVRFAADATYVPSEAQRDAETLRDLERRAGA